MESLKNVVDTFIKMVSLTTKELRIREKETFSQICLNANYKHRGIKINEMKISYYVKKKLFKYFVEVFKQNF